MLARLQGLLRVRFWNLVLPVMIGLAVIVAAGLVVVHFRQQGAARELQDKIAQAERLVDAFERRADDFALELEQAEKERDTVNAAFPDEVDDLVVYRDLFRLAEGGNVILVITSAGDAAAKKTVEGINYQVLTFTAQVSGGYYEVTNFVSMLDHEQGLLGSLVIENMKIKVDTTSTMATLKLSIYYLVK